MIQNDGRLPILQLKNTPFGSLYGGPGGLKYSDIAFGNPP